MSKQVTGTVYKVYDREFRGRMTHTVKIDGDPTWYRAGNKRFAGIAEPGNVVTFTAEPNPGRDDAKIISDITLAAPAPAAASGTPYADGNRDNSIVYQSSRKDAIALVQVMLAAGALKIPKPEAKRAGAIELAVDRYTALFFEDVGTLGAVTREAEGAGEEAETGADEESDDSDE